MIKKRLVGLLSHAKKYIAAQVLLQWVALLAQITAVFTMTDLAAWALKTAVSGDNAAQALPVAWMARIVLILGVCMVVRFACERLAARASYLASADVKKILRRKIYEKMLTLGPSYREQAATSEVTQVSTEGVEQLETYFGRYLPQLFYSLLAPLTLFIVLAPVSLKAAAVLLVCVPLIPLSIVAVQKIAKRLLSKYWGVYTELGDSFLENLQGLTTLKIYQADAQKAEEMDEEAAHFRRITMKVLTMQLNSTSVMDIVAYGGAAAGMITAVTEVAKGRLDFAGALCIILLASEFFLPLRLLGSYFHIAMNGMAASDRIFRILDLAEPEQGTRELPGGALPVTLADVSFSYEEGREILHGVSLKASAGSFVSLVGESGCGKSTIAGLIGGRNRGFAGEVRIGGIPVQEIRGASLLSHVVLVRHDSYLFKGTIAENLRMAKSEAADAELIAVLRRVNLWDFLTQEAAQGAAKAKRGGAEREDAGLAFRLAERASNLSGGQRQRLSLARALLKDAPVYLFDEATSNIDAESEELIMEVIRELARTKTVILISHRLANVVQSDCIYLLEDGRIAEQGTHGQLLKMQGAYARLYERQRALEEYGQEPERREAAV